MKIGFDAKRFFHNFTGLGNYSRFVVDAISKHQRDNQLFLFTPSKRSHPDVNDIASQSNVHTVTPSFPWSLAGGSIWRTGLLSGEKVVKKLDIFHGLSHELPLGLPPIVKKVVTVHDLIFLRYPEFYNPLDIRIYRNKVVSACRRADRIVAISEQTRDDIVEFLEVDQSRISIVYQGCHPQFRVLPSVERKADVVQRYSLPSEFILSVGTIEKRKNLELLIRALALIEPSKRIPLVVVGKPTAYLDELKALVGKNKLDAFVTFIHNAAFADLPAFYSLAALFVYPSLFEGFGIPLVEAIECGVPVVTSRGSCFSEAAGPSSSYVDPKDPEGLAAVILRLIETSSEREHSLAGAKLWIKKFSPEQIASELVSVYRSL